MTSAVCPLCGHEGKPFRTAQWFTCSRGACRTRFRNVNARWTKPKPDLDPELKRALGV